MSDHLPDNCGCIELAGYKERKRREAREERCQD